MKVADLYAALGVRPDKKSFKKADRLLGTVRKAIAGIVAYKSVKWLAGLVQDTAQAADNFSKLSKKVGISTEALQQLEFAAEIGGTNLQVMRTGLQRLARGMSDAQRGSKLAVDTFKDLGVEFETSDGKLRELDVVLMDLADQFAAMPNGPRKTARAMELFGRAGAELIPFLNEGSGGIGKLREEFVELGAQIDGETAKSFEEFNDDQLRVRTAMKGIRNQVVIALLPTLKTMTKQMLAWIKANKELLKQKLQSAIKGLIFGIKMLAKVVGVIVGLMAFFAEHSTLAKVALGALITTFAVLKVVSIGAAIASAAAWIGALFPFILLAALIGGLIFVVMDLWDWFAGGESVFKRLHEWAVDAFVGIIEWVARIVEKVKEAVLLVADFAADPTGSKFDKVGGPTRGSIVGRRLQNQFRNVRKELVERELSNQTATNIGDTTINVNVPAGADGQVIGTAVRKEMDGYFEEKVREAYVGTSR